MTRAQAAQSPAAAWKVRSVSKVDLLAGSHPKASASAAAAAAVFPRAAQSTDAARKASPAAGSAPSAARRLARASATRMRSSSAPDARKRAASRCELGVGCSAGSAAREGAPPFLRGGVPVARGEQGLGQREAQVALGGRVEGQELPQRVGESGVVPLRALDPAKGIERLAVSRVCVGDAAPQAARQLRVGGLGPLGDPAERPQGSRVARDGVDHPSVGLGGASWCRQAVLAQLGQDEEQPGPLLAPGLDLDQRVENGGQVGPSLELAVEPLQGGQRPRRQGRVETTGLLVERGGIGDPFERPLVQHPEPHRHRAAGVAEARELLREQRSQLVVLPGGGVDPLQDGGRSGGVANHRRLDLRQGAGVVGTPGQDLVEQRQRASGVLQPLVAQRGQCHSK